jgi:hypothetical protein
MAQAKASKRKLAVLPQNGTKKGEPPDWVARRIDRMLYR